MWRASGVIATTVALVFAPAAGVSIICKFGGTNSGVADTELQVNVGTGPVMIFKSVEGFGDCFLTIASPYEVQFYNQNAGDATLGMGGVQLS